MALFKARLTLIIIVVWHLTGVPGDSRDVLQYLHIHFGEQECAKSQTQRDRATNIIPQPLNLSTENLPS